MNTRRPKLGMPRLFGPDALNPMEEDPHWDLDWISQKAQEKSMQAASKGRVRVRRAILWKSQNGKLCVVPGPFPRGLFRSDTSKTVGKAALARASAMYGHEESTRDDRFALVRTEDVDEIDSGDNEFGPVCP